MSTVCDGIDSSRMPRAVSRHDRDTAIIDVEKILWRFEKHEFVVAQHRRQAGFRFDSRDSQRASFHNDRRSIVSEG